MNALVPVNQPHVPAFTVSEIERVALAIAKGGLFGSKDPNAVLTLCMLAQAEGQHPATVFRDYHIISGKPAKKADAMLRDFLSSGGRVEWHRLDDECADATFTHPSGEARIDWTMKRAQQAGIANPMWKKYPRQMLRSRVISEGVRTVYPGATSGLYVTEEVQDFAPAPPAAEEVTHGGLSEPSPPAEPAPDTAPEQQRDEPAPREKLEGKHSSKTALKEGLQHYTTKIIAAQSSREVDAIVKEFAADLAQGERYLPIWMNGDPNNEDKKGLIKLTNDRRAFWELVEDMRRCQTQQSLTGWMADREADVDSLDDGARRQFEREFDNHEVAINAMDTVSN